MATSAVNKNIHKVLTRARRPHTRSSFTRAARELTTPVQPESITFMSRSLLIRYKMLTSHHMHAVTCYDPRAGARPARIRRMGGRSGWTIRAGIRSVPKRSFMPFHDSLGRPVHP